MHPAVSVYSDTFRDIPQQFHTLRGGDPSQTIREKRREPMTTRGGALSRASLVHGSSHTGGGGDKWYDVDAFLLDQVREVLEKLSEGSIDDEIWGKIVIMERCKRVAKAYLRKTTVIIDGSEDEFDGKTLGFNFFENSERDEQVREIRTKIGDGVILKMDLQGNVKGMSRGAAPVICQGYRGEKFSCVSDRLIRQQGRLNANNNEEEKAYKMFDMRKFKHILDRDIHDGIPDPRSLLLRTCVRVALVKDGIDMSKTPCWFSIVNLVALDMLKEKVPNIASLVQVEFDRREEYLKNSSKTISHSSISQEALTQIIAAAVSQVNKGLSTSMQSLPVSQEQIAHLASTLSLGPGRAERKERSRKVYHSSTSSLDSSGEETRISRMPDTRQKRFDVPPDDFYDSGVDKTRERDKKKPTRAVATRPRLSDVVFNRSHSITSDYDSNRELFDSGSWSSTNSREFKSTKTHHAPFPPVIQADELREVCPQIVEELVYKVEENNTPILVKTPPPPPLSPPPTINLYDEVYEARVTVCPEDLVSEEPPSTIVSPEPTLRDDNEEVVLAKKAFSRTAARRWRRTASDSSKTHSSTSSDRSYTSEVRPCAFQGTTASRECAETCGSLGCQPVSEILEACDEPTTCHHGPNSSAITPSSRFESLALRAYLHGKSSSVDSRLCNTSESRIEEAQDDEDDAVTV